MKVLLAVDGSAGSMQAVSHVLAQAQAGLQVEVVLVNVQVPANLYEVMTAQDPEVIRAVRGSAGADLLAPAEALLDAAGVSYESEVAGGDPAHVIVELAESYACDAIVLGASGPDSSDDVLSAALDARRWPVTVVPVPEAYTEFANLTELGPLPD